jgi:Ca2+-binding EF-hand superfamily protein
MEMYHFNEVELHELQEAFLYFGCCMIPVDECATVNKSQREKESESPTGDKQMSKPKGKLNKKPAKGGKQDHKSDAASKAGKKGKKGADKDEDTEAAENKIKPRFGLNACGIAKCLRVIGQNPTEMDLTVIRRMAGPEPVSMTSFLYAVDCWKLRSVCGMETDLWDAFKVFDQDGSCRISIYDPKNALECYGEPLDADDMQELLCMTCPRDCDGMFDIATVVHKLINVPYCSSCYVTADKAAEDKSKLSEGSAEPVVKEKPTKQGKGKKKPK